tara:strand:- start:32 stop:346 length:315 start_codon:yes stop_codon:yes gene_type:complete
MRYVIVLFLLLFAAPASALDLTEARSRGLVGETPQGYIAPIKTPTPEVTALVNQVNAARRDEYQSIAARTGSTLPQVETVIGQQIYKQVPNGTYLMVGGRWQQK